MSLEEELESHYLLHDMKFKVDGELVSPSAKDIRDVIERAKELLAEGGMLEIAGMIIQKQYPDQELYDVYVKIGEEHG